MRQDLKKKKVRVSSSLFDRVFWKWGSLRFAIHGVWAILTFVVTSAGILSNDERYLWPSIVTNECLAVHAYSLLEQVPLSTKIIPGFVAPHREAFKRTIAMMHYTNLRLLKDVLPQTLHYPLLAVAWWQFQPFNSDFRNGNTWVFVVPMFVGVTLDLCQSILMAHGYCSGMGDMVAWQWLLGVHLSAQIMAFGFTLAFRGIIVIQYIYFGAVFFVALLFAAGSWLIFSSTEICSMGAR